MSIQDVFKRANESKGYKVGTRLKFKDGKMNTQSQASARREGAKKSGSSYDVGTRIKL